MKHLFLTGRIQVGKSTLLQRWLARTDVRTGGFFTKKEPERDGCIYVHILRAGNDDSFRDDNILFDCLHRNKKDAVARFNRLGTAYLEKTDSCQLIIMDEIGYMETEAEDFKKAVIRILDGSVPVIGVLRKDSSPFIDSIKSRPDVTVIEVTEENRDELAKTLPGILKSFESKEI